MSQLALRYEYDASFFDPKLARDDFGWLSVSVSTDCFAGRDGFWVQWQEVKKFAEALAAFPIVQDAPIIVEWGYEMLIGNDLILRIEIAPANKRGDLAVKFEIADNHEPTNRVRGMFQTNYPDLDAFRIGIAGLMNGEIDEAVLTGR